VVELLQISLFGSSLRAKLRQLFLGGTRLGVGTQLAACQYAADLMTDSQRVP